MIPDEEAKAAPEQSHATPVRGPRRSRRGGRRHSRRRERPGPARQPAEEQMRTGVSAAPVEVEPERGPEPESTESKVPPVSAIGQAIQQVSQILEELKRVLDQTEEVLETLELAERQKIDDEREIETLQRALRRLHRPGQTDPQRR